MYLAVGIFCNGMETFTGSRETDSANMETVVDMLCEEFQFDRDNLDTILLLRNGTSVPEVVYHWSISQDF